MVSCVFGFAPFCAIAFLAMCLGAWRVGRDIPELRLPLFAILAFVFPTFVGIGSTRVVCLCHSQPVCCVQLDLLAPMLSGRFIRRIASISL